MDYSKKSKVKILLFIAAAALAIMSLLYTNYLATKIAREEKNNVKLWAKAIERRANLVKLTGDLFDKIAEDQRITIQSYAEATSLLTIVDDIPTITFLSKIITGNTNVPVILTDSKKQVIDSRNIEIPKVNAEAFLDSLLNSSFAQYEPIQINYLNTKNYIYYGDSRIFSQLKSTLGDLVESFISDVVVNSAHVPVVLVNRYNKLVASGNIDSTEVLPENLDATLAEMERENLPLEVDLGNGNTKRIYYRNSFILRQLRLFPFIQLGLFGILILIGYLAFSSARNAEQNRVWVGLAKETAHQLGTPISSLSAWVDFMKETNTDATKNQFIEEVEKDVTRLELVAERFSKIGSKPDLTKMSVQVGLENAMQYMQARASKKVEFELELEVPNLYFEINESLFNWVIENLIKNAIDAMAGVGKIKLRAFQSSKNLIIDITDTGKGIDKSNYSSIFQPGFSTKKRGWGLGLSLVKRIIESYHKGSIDIKESSENGTTFRIKLPLQSDN